jgi:CRP-like cAMP-binding protein/cytochrome P450
MQTIHPNDQVRGLTRVLAAFIVPFLVAAFVILYVFTGRAGDLWAFTLNAQITALWQGAGYIAGGYFFVQTFRASRWHHVAAGFWPVTVFASLLGIATALQWDGFIHERPAFVAWAVLYFSTPALVPLVWLLNRQADSGAFDARDAVLPRSARWILGTLGFVNIAAGIVFFVWPQAILPFWPWAVTPLAMRVLGAWFVLPGVFFVEIGREKRWSAVRYAVQSQALGLALIMLALLRAWQELNLANPLTWLLLLGIAGLLAALTLLYVTCENRVYELAAPGPDEASLAALPLPPRVPGLPLLGNGLDFLRDLPGAFVGAYRTHGPIFRVRAPGYAFTVLAGPDANLFFSRHGEAVFSSSHAYRRVARDLNSDHYLQAMDGAAHDRLRRKLQPGFSREALGAYIPRIAQAIHQTASAWPIGQRLNVRAMAMALSAEAACLALANTRVGDRFDDLRRYAETLIGAGVVIWPPILLRLPPYVAARARIERFLDEILAAHEAQPPGDARPADLVDLVLAIRDEQGRPLKHADQRACIQVIPVNSVMYVGRAFGFALYELLKHPATLARVAKEVDAVFDRGLPDPAMLRQMTALRGCVLESLRLHPSAIVLPRHVMRTFEFDGYRVDAGTTVMLGTTLGHFDPALFPMPGKFDIDRYAEPRSEHRQPGAFAPFGAGAHTCLSLGMVEVLLMVGLATLLRTVRLELDPPNYVLRTVVDPVPGPETAFHVRVLERRAAGMPVDMVPPERMTADELAMVLPSLDPAQLARLTLQLKSRVYPAGAVLVREGDPADYFYILMSGEVAVLKRASDGKAQEVARLQPGSYFGEIGLLHGMPRTATVRALTPVKVLALDRETFIGVVVESDLTSAEIAQLMRQRYVSTHLAVALPSVSAETLQGIAANCEAVRYPPDAVIIRQGDPAEKFYIISRGRVEIVNRHPSGRDIVLAELGPGEYFGEVGLLQGRTRSATIRAISEVEVLELGRQGFEALIAGSPPTGEAISLRMVERLTDLLAAAQTIREEPAAGDGA